MHKLYDKSYCNFLMEKCFVRWKMLKGFKIKRIHIIATVVLLVGDITCQVYKTTKCFGKKYISYLKNCLALHQPFSAYEEARPFA